MKKKIIATTLGTILGIPIALTATPPAPVNAQSVDPNTVHGFGNNESVHGYELPGTTTSDNDDDLIEIIKKVINRVLGLLSLIALILCLYGGFQMLTAAGDDGKVKTGTKILKNAAIGLVVIGLSWLLVSLIFRIITKFAGQSGG